MCKISRKLVSNKIIAMLISILIVINPFTIELMIYLEKGLMILSLCASIYAVYYVMNYFEDKRKLNLAKAIIALLISTFSYQGVTPIFVCISLALIMKYSNTIKDFIKNNVVVAFCFAIPYLLNFLCIQLFYTSTRISGDKSLLANSMKIFSMLPSMIIDTYHTLPKYTFVIVFVLLVLIYMVAVILNKKRKPTFSVTKTLFGYFYVILGTFLVTILPQLVLETKSVELVARSTIAFGAIIGITMLYTFSMLDIQPKIQTLIKLITFVYLIIELFWLHNLILDHYTLNYLDFQTATLIEQEIEKYEKLNNTKIHYIVYYEDSNISNSYPSLINDDQINQKISSMYSRLPLLNFVSGKNYQETANYKGEYDQFFKQHNWDFFDSEQLIFENDTVHICQF